MTLINQHPDMIELTANDRDPQEVRALARMIVFARQNAIDLNLENAVHCLDLALRSVVQESDSTLEGLKFRESDLQKLRAH